MFGLRVKANPTQSVQIRSTASLFRHGDHDHLLFPVTLTTDIRGNRSVRGGRRRSLGDTKMLALHKQLQSPLTRERDTRDRERIIAAFPALEACADSHFLALRRYLDKLAKKYPEHKFRCNCVSIVPSN